MPINCQILSRDQFAVQATLFEQRSYLVGRHTNCEIQIPAADVSRQHALIYYDSGCWYIRDLGSKNGLFIEGQHCKTATLSAETLVTVGSQNIRLTPVSHRQLTVDINHHVWRRKRAQTLLRECSAEPNLAKLITSAQRTANFILGSDRAALIVIDSTRVLRTCRGFPQWLSGQSFDGSTTLIKQAIYTASPVAVNNAQTHLHLQQRPSVQANHIKAAVACPIMQNGHVIAVLYADSQAHHHCFTQQDIELLEAFTRQISIHITVKDIDDQITQVEQQVTTQYA